MTIENEISFQDYTIYLEELSQLFSEMDKEYESVAGKYGFVCNGCKDNCCYSTFYHHTLSEYLYFKKGIRALDQDTRQRIEADAIIAVDKAGRGEKIMCPANIMGMCRVYNYRPMVCRLHGIANELKRFGQAVISPGCDLFTEITQGMEYIRFDRTSFYIRMAGLEKKIRTHSGYMGKIRYTIAEMIIK